MSAPTITVLDHRSMTVLLLGLALVIAPSMITAPIWISIAVIGFGLWRWTAARKGWGLPNTPIRLVCTVVTAGAIFIQFGTLIGLTPGITLLVAMIALKLTELRRKRDVWVLLFMAYFIQVTHFLFSQDIFMVLYVFLTTWLLLALHLHLSRIETSPLKYNLRAAGRLMAQALPLMVALFILFPRLPGPIWQLPKDAHSGMTGLSDSMTPGAISSLIQSDEIAFRVTFDDLPPPTTQRYWRGPVLTLTDGRSWLPLQLTSPPNRQFPEFARASAPVSYTVTLEPHNRNWLFSLDLPSKTPPHSRMQYDYQILANSPILTRQQYSMTSYTDYVTSVPLPQELDAALMLPTNSNPRTRTLAQQLRSSSHSNAELITKALAMFRNQPFTYTLQPPLLTSEHTTDEFLFDTKKGFCEHFSSSFTVLMRAAGIPARVVTGYQGGELNPVGEYFIVRQRDAHAWSEVWLDGQGWLRIDPTAAVAPERIERSIDFGNSDAGSAVQFSALKNQGLMNAWHQLRLNLDALNNHWNQWVLGYDAISQAELLRYFDIDVHSWRDMAAVFAWTLGILLALIWLVGRPKNPQPTDISLKNYQIFCRKLAKRGIHKLANESPRDFSIRAINTRPDLADNILDITTLYTQLRYGKAPTREQEAKLKNAVLEFSP